MDAITGEQELGKMPPARLTNFCIVFFLLNFLAFFLFAAFLRKA